MNHARSRLLTLVAVGAWVGACTGERRPNEPAPRSAPLAGAPSPSPPSSAADLRPLRPAHRGAEMLARNAECEACHVEVADEWRGSLHRGSWTEGAFQRAFRREPMSFCQSCHAPEANPRSPPTDAVGALGTGCVTCHVVGDAILGATRRSDDGATSAAPHAVLRDGRLDGDLACEGCHELSFPPGGRPLGDDVPMQSTVREHRASPASDTACAACHMPGSTDTPRRRSHRFVSSRDPARVRAAVTVDARRSSATAVTIRLQSNVGGHRFPTGDLFRRIEVTVEAVAQGEILVAQGTRHLTRHFPSVAARPGGPRRRSVGPDDRLDEKPRTLVFDLGPAAAAYPVRYRVAYQRVAHPAMGAGLAAELDGEIVLADGVLMP